MPKSMISLSVDLDFELSGSVRSVYSFVSCKALGSIRNVRQRRRRRGEGGMDGSKCSGRVARSGPQVEPGSQISNCVLQRK